MEYISIKNLDKYQHYKDRSLIWIKWHIDCLMDYKFMSLSASEKWVFLGLICLACKMSNKIPKDIGYISKQLDVDSETVVLAIDKMIASKLLAGCYQGDILDKSREEKIRKEKNPPNPLLGELLVPEDLKESEKEIMDWLCYKKEKGQNYKPKGLEALWKVFRSIPESQRRQSVENSMANNWAGLFQVKGSNGIKSTSDLIDERNRKDEHIVKSRLQKGLCPTCGSKLVDVDGEVRCEGCNAKQAKKFLPVLKGV